jgi:hypothetical protein
MPDNETQKWLTVDEFAKLVGKSRAQVYLDIRTGKLKNYKREFSNVPRKRLLILAP